MRCGPQILPKEDLGGNDPSYAIHLGIISHPIGHSVTYPLGDVMGDPENIPSAANFDAGPEKTLRRRLAAIVFADVAGYSRLMHEDEAGTITALKDHLGGLIEPAISEHEGRLVKTTGDGVLMEFPSAIAAVSCAIDIQRGMILRNAEIPENRRIEFRIGINLSDVVVDDADILGDGVNVAARLESIADANGICVADDVYHIVKNKIDADIDCIGDITLKNLPKAVKAYRVSVAPKKGARGAPGHSQLAKAVTAEPLLAVMPFENLSSDPEQHYFSDGITNDLISNLSQFPELGVIASHSVFTYKGRQAGVASIAEELGVRYIVEGSVQRARDTLRINVQLIDAHVDRHLWSDRFQGRLSEIFDMQEEITRKVAATVVSRVQVSESARSMLKPPDSLEAYDFLLRGFRVWYLWTRDANQEAQDWFRKAIDIDPNFARAHSAYTFSLIQACLGGWTKSPEVNLQEGLKHAQIAVALSPFDFEAYDELGLAFLYNRQFDRSLQCYERALALNCNSPDLLADFADTLAHIGRTVEAAEMILQAKRLNPIYPDWYDWVVGIAAFHDGRYEEALSAFQRFSNPPLVLRRDIVATYVRLGRLEEARALAKDILREQPDYRLATETLRPFKSPELLRNLVADLRLAGLPD